MKIFKYMMIGLFAFLVHEPLLARESASQRVIIRIMRRNFVRIQPIVNAASGSPVSNDGRFQLNWNLSSVLKKITVSVNQIEPGSALDRQADGGTPNAPSMTEWEMMSGFSKTAGSMQMGGKTAPTDGAVHSQITCTILDI
jgi:hypothetical protein